MNKTLYITDLDGTLLGPDALLSSYTVDTINRFIAGGGLFTVATGRTWPRTQPIVKDLDLSIPMSFCNGAMLYHPGEGGYVRVHEVPPSTLARIAESFDAADITGFYYVLDGDDVKIYHPPIRHEIERTYRNERYSYYNGGIHEAADLPGSLSRFTVFNCSAYGGWNELEAVRAYLADLPDIGTAIYGDVYNDSLCFLDVCSAQVSKSNSMREIAELCGASRTVAFGDNLNDIPMLLAADESYVTLNGVDDAKRAATGVIGACSEDGVARYLAGRYGL